MCVCVCVCVCVCIYMHWAPGNCCLSIGIFVPHWIHYADIFSVHRVLYCHDNPDCSLLIFDLTAEMHKFPPGGINKV